LWGDCPPRAFEFFLGVKKNNASFVESLYTTVNNCSLYIFNNFCRSLKIVLLYNGHTNFIMRYKLTLQYDGTPFKGWQRQSYTPNTVQGNIESALSKVCNHAIEVHPSGRTDVGVHALGQVVHFDTQVDRDCNRIVSGCNHFLEPSIRVKTCELVVDDFHARYCAKYKTYQYKFCIGDYNPILQNRVLFLNQINIETIRQACSMIEGQHDFGSFCGSGGKYHTTVRNVHECVVYTDICVLTGLPIVTISITSKGFLYNMVRLIAGLIYRIGSGIVGLEVLEHALKVPSREHTSYIAPACALYLVEVGY